MVRTNVRLNATSRKTTCTLYARMYYSRWGSPGGSETTQHSSLQHSPWHLIAGATTTWQLAIYLAVQSQHQQISAGQYANINDQSSLQSTSVCLKMALRSTMKFFSTQVTVAHGPATPPNKKKMIMAQICKDPTPETNYNSNSRRTTV